MLTWPMLAFLFALLLMFICLAVLIALAPARRIRNWYLVFLASFIGWLALLYTRPEWFGSIWLYLIPMLWIALTLRYTLPPAGLPLAGYAGPAQLEGEPRRTQEQLRGRAGTREALGFYFAILLIGATVTVAFLISAFSLP